MKAKVMTITPELARRWLKSNTKNRNASTGLVKRIWSDISALRWIENGQSIIFDTDGCLLDGQHRLMAIANGDQSVRAVVVTGVSPEAMSTIDCGRGRTFADVCRINGEPNAGILAAATKLLWRHKRGQLFATSVHASNADLEDFLDEHPGLTVSASVGRACRGACSGSAAAFAHYVFSQSDSDKADAFFEGLRTGADLGPRSPVLALRNTLLEARAKKHTPLSRSAELHHIWSAWRAFSAGRALTRLRLPKDGRLTFGEAA